MAEDKDKEREILNQIRDLLEEINNLSAEKEKIDLRNVGINENLQEKLSEILDKKLQMKYLSEDDYKILEKIDEINGKLNEAGEERVGLSEQENRFLQERLKYKDEEISKSKTITTYQLQQLKATGDILSPLSKARELHADINKLTDQQKEWWAKGMAIKAAASLGDKIMNLVSGFSKIRAELNQLTPDAAGYAESIREAAEAVPGLSFQEAAASQRELMLGMSNFTRMTQEQRTEITKNVAAMDKLGFSSKNSAMFMETATKSLGMTTDQASNSLRKLKTFADQTNIPMKELDKNFSAMANKLSAFGKEGYEKVFQSLSLAAKNLGVEASKLLQITEGFTTFEGAASAAGQLNAALGGNFINSINLLDASMRNPIEAFEQLKEAMDASGKSFEEMSPAHQRYIASVLNMDVAEAQKLFSQSLGSATAQMEAQAKSEKELAELAAKSTDVFTRLEVAMQKIVASPLVDYLVTLIENFAWLIETIASIPILGEGIGIIIGVIGITSMAVIAFNGVLTGLVTTLNVVVGVMKVLRLTAFANWIQSKLTTQAKVQEAGATNLLAGAQQRAAAATSTSAVSMSGAIPVMLAFGAAVLMIGVGIGIAAAGLSLLVDSVVGLSESGTNAAAILVGIGAAVIITALLLLKFSPVITLTAGLIWSLVGAFIALGAAIVIVAAAFGAYKLLTESSRKDEIELQKAQNKSLELLSALGGGAAALEARAAAFATFAEGIRLIAAELENLPVEKMEKLAELTGMSVETALVPTAVPPPAAVTTAEQAAVAGAVTPTAATTVATTSAALPKQIALKIDAPVQLEGQPFGRMIYNGVATYMEESGNEISPSMPPSTTELLQ